MKTVWIKMNEEPIPVEWDENDENVLSPYFLYGGEKHFLNDFVRIHHNIWFGNDALYPDFIHAVKNITYFYSLFVEIVDGGECVNVWTKEEK